MIILRLASFTDRLRSAPATPACTIALLEWICAA